MPILNTTETITLTAGGGTKNLPVDSQVALYIITGTATLTSNWTIQASGTPLLGTEYRFRYEANIVLGSNSITIFGATLPTNLADKTHQISAYYNGSSWEVDFIPDISENNVIPLSVLEDNGWKVIPSSVETMINGDNSPVIENSVQSEGTTQSKLYYKCDPNSKLVEICGIVDVVSVDETAVTGTLSVQIMRFNSGNTNNLGLFLNVPITVEYQTTGTTSNQSGASSPTFKSGYIQKQGASTTVSLIVPNANLGTSTTARYSSYINIQIYYS